MTENLHKQGLRFISTYSSAEGRHLSHYLANMLHWRGKMTLDIWNSLSNLCLKPFADRVSQKATPCVHRTTKFIGWLWPHGLHTTTVTVKAVWQVFGKCEAGNSMNMWPSVCTSYLQSSWWWCCRACWRLPRFSVPLWKASLMSSCSCQKPPKQNTQRCVQWKIKTHTQHRLVRRKQKHEHAVIKTCTTEVLQEQME